MPVSFTVHGPTMQIVLDRPARRNAMDHPMAQQLERALDELESRHDVRVAILSGADGHFCAGTDLTLPRSPSTTRGGEYGIVRRERSKPVIAAIEGVAFGGGLEIAMSCDLVVAAAGARLALPEARRGVVPTCGGIFRLLNALPDALAMGLLLAGDELDGETAGRHGLVTRVVPDGEALAAADELATAVCRSSPTSVSALLRAARRIRSATELIGWQATEEAIQAVDDSPDMRDGIAAFFDRRPPRWDPGASRSGG